MAMKQLPALLRKSLGTMDDSASIRESSMASVSVLGTKSKAAGMATACGSNATSGAAFSVRSITTVSSVAIIPPLW